MMNRDLSPAVWRKSSYSGGEENCVEVAGRPGAVAVRDSKDASGPALKFGRGPWHAFTDKIKNES
jgi:hypothetical protein